MPTATKKAKAPTPAPIPQYDFSYNLEASARASTICPCCGRAKSVGTIVCWDECWNNEQWGFKYSGMELVDWLTVNKHRYAPKVANS